MTTDLRTITDAEKQELIDITAVEEKTVLNLGITEYSIHQLQKQKEQIILRIEEIQQAKNVKMTALQSKYGAGEININTGEFTPTK